MIATNRQALWTAMGLAFSRGILGLIFFMAGEHKVFVLGPVGHVVKYFLPFQDTVLPTWSLWAVGFTIPFVELLAGALVLLGWYRTVAYASLGAVLMTVTFGHLMHDSLYAFHEHVIPRFALLVLLLLMPPAADRWSLDEWLERRGRAKSGASERDA
ncbi:MAG: hypothetical protein ABJE47_04635 [bacterium]